MREPLLGPRGDDGNGGAGAGAVPGLDVSFFRL
jgi:hypothetical protein